MLNQCNTTIGAPLQFDRLKERYFPSPIPPTETKLNLRNNTLFAKLVEFYERGARRI